MKILIDIDELEQDGTVPHALAATLRAHNLRHTGTTAINLLLAFGAIAIAGGLLTLVGASVGLSAFFGAGFVLLGWLIGKQYADQWSKLASIWMIIGALVLSGSVGWLTHNPFLAPLIAAVILTAVGVLARSALLIALVPFSLAAAIGGSTGYWHACYAITVREPTLTILLFSALALGAWQFAKLQKGTAQNLSIIFARVCVILVNFGFWIGSLWGDTPGRLWNVAEKDMFSNASPQIPSLVFVAGWAAALLAVGFWGAREGRKFMVNVAAVFGAIHFYTQWFEVLGANPLSVIVAGVFTVAFALALWRYNRNSL